ncbi:unnamed protein product [Symbiodinium sp. CCMP2592]|nr:unnamed protein product [Symbiodinium sp. CCMP2592]
MAEWYEWSEWSDQAVIEVNSSSDSSEGWGPWRPSEGQHYHQPETSKGDKGKHGKHEGYHWQPQNDKGKGKHSQSETAGDQHKGYQPHEPEKGKGCKGYEPDTHSEKGKAKGFQNKGKDIEKGEKGKTKHYNREMDNAKGKGKCYEPETSDKGNKGYRPETQENKGKDIDKGEKGKTKHYQREMDNTKGKGNRYEPETNDKGNKGYRPEMQENKGKEKGEKGKTKHYQREMDNTKGKGKCYEPETSDKGKGKHYQAKGSQLEKGEKGKTDLKGKGKDRYQPENHDKGVGKGQQSTDKGWGKWNEWHSDGSEAEPIPKRYRTIDHGKSDAKVNSHEAVDFDVTAAKSSDDSLCCSLMFVPVILAKSENSGESQDSGFEGLRRQARVRALTDEEKSRIAAYEKPSDMPYEERKRQLVALDRRVKSDPESLPPGILAMYNDAYGSSAKKFELMKHFILDPSFQSMTVDARFLERHSKDCIHGPSFFLGHLRTKIYCTEEQRKWLKEKIVDCRILSYRSNPSTQLHSQYARGQEGKEHPQDAVFSCASPLEASPGPFEPTGPDLQALQEGRREDEILPGGCQRDQMQGRHWWRPSRACSQAAPLGDLGGCRCQLR